IRDTASQEERASRILEDPDDLLHPISEDTERLLDLLRRQPEATADLPQVSLGDSSANAGERQCQQVEYGDLGDEGLGRSNTDLEPRLREQDRVGLTCDERPSGIGNRKHPGPEAPCRLNGRQSIRGLPALAYGNDERVVVSKRVRVPLLATVPNSEGNPG